jgi:hypothetical protein
MFQLQPSLGHCIDSMKIIHSADVELSFVFIETAEDVSYIFLV